MPAAITAASKTNDTIVDKSILDLNDVKNTVEQFPCLSAERVEKQYPSAVYVEVRERKETYAVRQENGFAVFDEEGRYLYEKADNVNRLDGDKNSTVKFSFSYAFLM